MAASDLAILREAAHAREWSTLQLTLTRLFTALGVFPALDVTLQRLQVHLPTFERYHGADGEKGQVLRGLMVAAMSFGFTPDTLPEFLVTEYDTPGSGQFAQAVLEMCRAMQKSRAADERPALLASAVANTILAELAEYWYSQRPELYARVRANRIDPNTGDYTDPDAVRIIPLHFWIDAEVAARDTAAWLAVADAVETRLGS